MEAQITAGVAIVAVGLSIIFGLINYRMAQKASETARQSNLIAERASAETSTLMERSNDLVAERNQMQMIVWTQSYFEPTRLWGAEVVQAMSEGINLRHIEGKEDRTKAWLRVRSRLSALIDAGRLDFPNRFDPVHGIDKPTAFRGYRRDILDYIVFTYDVLDPIPSYDPQHSDEDEADRHALLVKYKRQFISELQAKLNPSKRAEKIAETIKWFDEAELLAKLKAPEDVRGS